MFCSPTESTSVREYADIVDVELRFVSTRHCTDGVSAAGVPQSCT